MNTKHSELGNENNYERNVDKKPSRSWRYGIGKVVKLEERKRRSTSGCSDEFNDNIACFYLFFCLKFS